MSALISSPAPETALAQTTTSIREYQFGSKPSKTLASRRDVGVEEKEEEVFFDDEVYFPSPGKRNLFGHHHLDVENQHRHYFRVRFSTEEPVSADHRHRHTAIGTSNAATATPPPPPVPQRAKHEEKRRLRHHLAPLPSFSESWCDSSLDMSTFSMPAEYSSSAQPPHQERLPASSPGEARRAGPRSSHSNNTHEVLVEPEQVQTVKRENERVTEGAEISLSVSPIIPSRTFELRRAAPAELQHGGSCSNSIQEALDTSSSNEVFQDDPDRGFSTSLSAVRGSQTTCEGSRQMRERNAAGPLDAAAAQRLRGDTPLRPRHHETQPSHADRPFQETPSAAVFEPGQRSALISATYTFEESVDETSEPTTAGCATTDGSTTTTTTTATTTAPTIHERYPPELMIWRMRAGYPYHNVTERVSALPAPGDNLRRSRDGATEVGSRCESPPPLPRLAPAHLPPTPTAATPLSVVSQHARALAEEMPEYERCFSSPVAGRPGTPGRADPPHLQDAGYLAERRDQMNSLMDSPATNATLRLHLEFQHRRGALREHRGRLLGLQAADEARNAAFLKFRLERAGTELMKHEAGGRCAIADEAAQLHGDIVAQEMSTRRQLLASSVAAAHAQGAAALEQSEGRERAMLADELHRVREAIERTQLERSQRWRHCERESRAREDVATWEDSEWRDLLFNSHRDRFGAVSQQLVREGCEGAAAIEVQEVREWGAAASMFSERVVQLKLQGDERAQRHLLEDEEFSLFGMLRRVAEDEHREIEAAAEAARQADLLRRQHAADRFLLTVTQLNDERRALTDEEGSEFDKIRICEAEARARVEHVELEKAEALQRTTVLSADEAAQWRLVLLLGREEHLAAERREAARLAAELRDAHFRQRHELTVVDVGAAREGIAGDETQGRLEIEESERSLRKAVQRRDMENLETKARCDDVSANETGEWTALIALEASEMVLAKAREQQRLSKLQRHVSVSQMLQRTTLAAREDQTRVDMCIVVETAARDKLLRQFEEEWAELQRQAILKRHREEREGMAEEEISSRTESVEVIEVAELQRLTSMMHETAQRITLSDAEERTRSQAADNQQHEWTTLLHLARGDRAEALEKQQRREHAEAAEAAQRALRARAERSRPFIGMSLAEKVTSPRSRARLSVARLTAENLEPRLVVDSLYVGGPAYNEGLRLGDIIVSVGGVRSSSLDAVRAAILKRGVVGQPISIVVRRQASTPLAATAGSPLHYDLDDDQIETSSVASVTDSAQSTAPTTSMAEVELMVPVLTINEDFRELEDIFFDVKAHEKIEREAPASPSGGITIKRTKSSFASKGGSRDDLLNSTGNSATEGLVATLAALQQQQNTSPARSSVSTAASSTSVPRPRAPAGADALRGKKSVGRALAPSAKPSSKAAAASVVKPRPPASAMRK